MRRGEEGGEAPSIPFAEKHGSIGSNRVEDGTQVVGPHVEVRRPNDRV